MSGGEAFREAQLHFQCDERIAALEAENVRLREALREAEPYIHANPDRTDIKARIDSLLSEGERG